METAFKTLTKIFKGDSEKDQNIAVRNYTGSVLEYYHIQKQKFLQLYTRRLELLELQEQIEHEGNVEGAQAELPGVRITKRRLQEHQVTKVFIHTHVFLFCLCKLEYQLFFWSIT
jgi:hypothetical protein